MAVRLSKKGIVLLVVLGLLLLGGVTGYLVWTVYYQNNLAPIDSEAGGSGWKCTDSCGTLQFSQYQVCGYGDKAKKYDACHATNGEKNSTMLCKDTIASICGGGGTKECKCCDGSNSIFQDDSTFNSKCSNFCKGSGGVDNGSCEEPKIDCQCESFANGCGVNCTFPAGTAAQVEAAAKGSCSEFIAMCRVTNGGGREITIEKFAPGHVCWGKQSECKNPTATDTCVVANPPSCTSLSLTSTQTQATSPLNLFSTDEILTATLTADDPDGNPAKVRICYSVRGQANTFYANAANWVCDEKATSKTLTVNRKAQDYIDSYAAKVTTFTAAQVEEAGLRFMSEITDSSTSTLCTSNPAIATGSNSVIAGTGANCGNICRATVDFQAAPVACGNGVLDAGEECDPGAAAGSPAASCEVGSCTALCTCPALTPGFNIQKVPVSQCIEGKDTYADVRYTIAVTNNGTTVGHMSQVVDDLDAKIQESWIVDSSITPSAGVTVANGQIIWNLDTASQTFDPGESMNFSYIVRIPEANFGTYRNIVTGIITDEGEENVTAQAVIEVDCLPNTGLLDNTIARIALASVLLVAGAYFAQSGSLDGFAFKFFTKTGQVERKRTTFEKSL